MKKVSSVKIYELGSRVKIKLLTVNYKNYRFFNVFDLQTRKSRSTTDSMGGGGLH